MLTVLTDIGGLMQWEGTAIQPRGHRFKPRSGRSAKARGREIPYAENWALPDSFAFFCYGSFSMFLDLQHLLGLLTMGLVTCLSSGGW